jgi:precorrin-2 dehydrogenase/sirohydrochlorin ferrochelatase
MKTYPIQLDIRQRRCLVVGGGRVAARKVPGLLSAGARVTVVSPHLHPPLNELAASGRIHWLARGYHVDDLQDVWMVIAATDQAGLNLQVAADARTRSVLCSVVDQPAAGDFTLPSVVRRGDLVLTVSTSGQSPALARRLRKELEDRFGNEYEGFLRLMGAVRRRLLSASHDPEAHRVIFTRLVEAELPEAIREARWDDLREHLVAILGPDYDETLLSAAGAAAETPNRQGQR